MLPDNSTITDIYMQIGDTTIRPATVLKQASGVINTPDGDTWKIIERSQGQCVAKSTTKFAEVCLFHCYNCPNKDNC